MSFPNDSDPKPLPGSSVGLRGFLAAFIALSGRKGHRESCQFGGLPETI